MPVDSDLTLRIEHHNGETSQLVVPTPTAIDQEAVTLSTIETQDVIDEMETAEATVFRESWLDIEPDLDRRNDELYIEPTSGGDIFGGRLADWQFDGGMVSVKLDSFERDSLDVEPPVNYASGETSDDQIATEIIGLMEPPLQTGTIEQTTATIEYDAPNRPPGQMLRELANSTGAEVQFHPNGAIDYVDRRGTDYTITISPTSGAVIGEPRIRRAISEEITHVRAVSDDDESLYEEAVAISVPAGEREKWAVERIDSTRSSRIQAHATEHANEYAAAPDYVEIEADLDPLAIGETPVVGDEFPVQLPAYNIDTNLRVVEADRIIDGSGDHVKAMLSNRKLTRRSYP